MQQRFPTIIILIILLSSCASIESQYQNDADLYRISHLIHYGELIHEYHEKSGHYPFQGQSDKQLQVSFATEEQKEHLSPDSDSIEKRSSEEFRTEVSTVLGREIELRFEPQRVPTSMPLYYLYVTEDDEYFFIVHLFKRYSFAANRGPGFNQVEITSSNIEHPGFWKFEELLTDQEFTEVASSIPGRSGWFDELQERHKLRSS